MTVAVENTRWSKFEQYQVNQQQKIYKNMCKHYDIYCINHPNLAVTMKTSWHWNAFHITGCLWKELMDSRHKGQQIGSSMFPLSLMTKETSESRFTGLLWRGSEQADKQTVNLSLLVAPWCPCGVTVMPKIVCAGRKVRQAIHYFDINTLIPRYNWKLWKTSRDLSGHCGSNLVSVV